MGVSARLPSRYKVDSSLGRGGFGEVHKAYDTELDMTVAIKILTNVTPASTSSLKKEFEVLSKLTQPQLVKVYSFGFISEDIPYFTMEYIDGEDLESFLLLPDAIAYIPSIVDHILQALCYLNEKHIIHGDLKPENILISTSRTGDVSTKILDFGLASMVQDIAVQVSGTPRFMAPEVLSQKTYTPASDLYALGMTLIESLTGSHVPIATNINPYFYKNTHSIISNLLASKNITNPSAISSFLLDLCDQNPLNRPKNSLEAYKRFKVIVSTGSHDISNRIGDIFVGRNRILELFHRFVDKNNVDTRVLLLEGSTGIGKKTLIQKAITIAQPHGHFVLDLSDPLFTRNTIEKIIDTISNNLPPEKRESFLERHNTILQLVKTQDDSADIETDKLRVAYSNIIEYLRAISGDSPILITIPDIERFSEDF